MTGDVKLVLHQVVKSTTVKVCRSLCPSSMFAWCFQSLHCFIKVSGCVCERSLGQVPATPTGFTAQTHTKSTKSTSRAQRAAWNHLLG